MIKNQYVLSICIPVYNCSNYLSDALDSILSQTTDDVEVVVFDGGSTDNTIGLMDNYTNAWKNLKYIRANTRGGIDADMATCVDNASGEYCWLFSGDDVMRQEAISRVINEIKSNHDVYICKHTICDIKMSVSHEHQVLIANHTFEADFMIGSQRLEWFKKAVTTEAFFSFMSGLIIKRETWESGRLIPKFDGSCWAHVARLLEISKNGLTVKFIPSILLDQRGDNDSFADRGVVNRFRIGIEGYHNIANHFYGANSEEAFHIRRVIRNEFGLQSLLSAKVEKENKVLLDHLVNIAYQDKSLSNYMVRFLYEALPYDSFLVARFFYRSLKKINMKFKNV
jgi:O-antigen biosynthesis alpha-1,3-abequosyltransferase